MPEDNKMNRGFGGKTPGNQVRTPESGKLGDRQQGKRPLENDLAQQGPGLGRDLGKLGNEKDDVNLDE